ncbi:MAG: protein kinase [Anaerolineales bacterium]|nr:protein kinase [Anaerolineales bacterium]
MMQELVGQSLNRYKILELLGEGGMGAVYKAHDVTLQRDVAIKIMHPHYARQGDFQERFLQEARTAARLDHPGIVQVYDFGKADIGPNRSLLYIVMEFIPGDNLEKMLRDLRAQGKWILLNEAVGIIRQASLALDYAHRQGVLHRDIKPGNIMLEPEASGELSYRPVLTDLGLAKLAGGAAITQEGVSMGTPAYMSPEQALGKQVDARSDVYSLGVLLYEMAVGQLPFPARTISDAIQYHVQTPPPPPRSLRPDLPEKLERLILQTMRKDPGERFTSAAILAQALEVLTPAAAKVASAPVSSQAAVSLFTQYQHSLVEPRGPSILDEFSPLADAAQDRIQILAPDKTSHFVTPSKTMTIGRGKENDITLDDPKASHQHARIEFDGANYRVSDLNSTNGTYLSNARLLPGIPEVWTPDKGLRIGDTWLRLQRARSSSTATGTVIGSTPAMPPATAVELARVTTSAGQRIGIFIKTAQFNVEPGDSTTIPIVLLNQGATVDHFKVSVTGAPAPWITVPPEPLHLMPGEQQETSVAVHPGRDSQSRAGRYPLTINVASQDAPDEFAETKVNLTVSAFSQFSSELHPQKLQARQIGRISIKNQGNTQESFALSWKDRGDELAFEPPQAQMKVAEGKQAAVEFRAAPRQRRWIGGEKSHPFSAQVSAASSAASQPQVHSGEIVSRALFPPWAPPLLFFACIAVAAALGLFYSRIFDQTSQATRTHVAWQTQLALDAQQTSQALTATADFQSTAAQSTLQASTATAAWLAGDDDRDGLSNEKELALGTLPNKRDTDEDGLDDGEEVNRNTDPLASDSDDDGLKDGDEVSQGIDPLNPDTDGDDIPDPLDPAPAQKPTDTPTPSPTPSPSPSPSITPSPIPSITPSPTSTAPIELTEADDGKTIRLKPGGMLSITLEGNPSTGYSWVIDSMDSKVLKQVGESEFKPYGSAPGSAGKVTLQFKALKPGSTILRLVYKQPWLQTPPGATDFEVTVVVE